MNSDRINARSPFAVISTCALCGGGGGGGKEKKKKCCKFRSKEEKLKTTRDSRSIRVILIYCSMSMRVCVTVLPPPSTVGAPHPPLPLRLLRNQITKPLGDCCWALCPARALHTCMSYRLSDQYKAEFSFSFLYIYFSFFHVSSSVLLFYFFLTIYHCLCLGVGKQKIVDRK